jgi:hypothetical protein
MTIEKNGKIYKVTEQSKTWTVSTDKNNVTVSAKITKADCPTFDDLKMFVAENDLF